MKAMDVAATTKWKGSNGRWGRWCSLFTRR